MSKIIAWVLDLLFPKLCTGCAKSGSCICKSCVLNKLEILHMPVCPVCRQEVAVALGIHEDCMKYSYLDGLVSVAKPTKALKALLHQGKYGFQYSIYKDLAWLLYLRCLEKGIFAQSVMITFVPLSLQRSRWRGFNQAQLLANFVAGFAALSKSEILYGRIGQTGLNLAEKNVFDAIGILKRNENRTHQVGLSRDMRLQNLKEEFYVDSEIISRYSLFKGTILLIDDVYTTGATLQQAAKAIKAVLPAANVCGCVLMQA